MAPEVGLEPTTLRLTAGCSTIELLRIGEPRRQPRGVCPLDRTAPPKTAPHRPQPAKTAQLLATTQVIDNSIENLSL